MIIFGSIKSGLYRSLKSWKAILVIWLAFLVIIAGLVLPLRNSLNSAFGSSMISENLADGFDIMAFTDLGPVLRSLTSYLTGGFVFICITAFVINAFLTGGLFHSIGKREGGFLSSEFFSASAKHFWSFLIISILITLFIIFLTGFLILIDVIVAGVSGSLAEKSIFLIMIITVLVLIFLLPVLLLVADYSRAWKVINGNSSAFRALRFGFSETFKRFRKSYLLMFIILLIQTLFGYLVLSVIPLWKPQSSAGLFIFFLVSQGFFILRLFIKSWRYASVTTFMEQNRVE